MRLALLACCLAATAFAGGKKPGGSIVLNGEETAVRWSDGDSFHIKSGKYEGKGTRLVGYNTLETFGPVHRWGEWTRQELFEIAKEQRDGRRLEGLGPAPPTASRRATSRLLVNCPDLAAGDGEAGPRRWPTPSRARSSTRRCWRRRPRR